ncbi:MAG: S9 family peptidase [Chloroflexi bacterium]|nr:S9 family peptidase [Chloroflexota bacterium]
MGQFLGPAALAYDLPSTGEPRVSPDGRAIIYTLTTPNREAARPPAQVWRCTIDGSDHRQLTWSGDHNGGAIWSPDGRQIAFVSDRVAAAGVFVLPTDGGEARELARHAQAITALAWSPDGARLAYTTAYDPDNPDETPLPAGAAPRVRVARRLDYKADGRGVVAAARQQVFVVDVASGERWRVTDGPTDHTTPQWSPDGRWLAAQRPAPAGAPWSQLVLHDLAGGASRVVGPDGGLIVSLWAWSPAGDRIAFAGDTAATGQLDLFVYDVAADAIVRLTDDLPVQPDAGIPGRFPPSHPVWLDERRLLIHAVRAGGSGLYTVDVTTAELTTLATWEAAHYGLSVDATSRYAVQQHSSPTAASEISVYDLVENRQWLASDVSRALLAEAPPATVERLTVPRGDAVIDAWLWRPSDFDPARRYPVVLDVHGGPQSHHGWGFSTLQQCLASHGFLVVSANPRGSDSYGRAFARQVIGDWGGEDYLDLMAVVDAVVARPETDPDRVGIYGPSYGGYMTAWTITQTDRFKAAVPVACVFDLESFYGTSDIGYFFGDIHAGGPPHERREWYTAHSPATHAHRVTTPTLIVHGEADERCPIGQAEQMFVALMRAGCDVEFARYPGGTHHGPRYGPPAHLEDFLTRVLAWFQRYLMPDA